MNIVDSWSEHQCRVILKGLYDEPMSFEEIKDWYIFAKKMRYTGSLLLSDIANDSFHGNDAIRTELMLNNKMRLSVFRNAIIEYNNILGMECFTRL